VEQLRVDSLRNELHAKMWNFLPHQASETPIGSYVGVGSAFGEWKLPSWIATMRHIEEADAGVPPQTCKDLASPEPGLVPDNVVPSAVEIG
jgi:hypothetical protein